MSTPKQIDLSKCKVGDRVRLRNGEKSHIKRFDKHTHTSYKFDGPGILSWKENGSYYDNNPHKFDIIAILPPAKKAAKKPAKKPAKKGATNKQWEAGKAKILRILDELEGLLKPCGKVGKPAQRRR